MGMLLDAEILLAAKYHLKILKQFPEQFPERLSYSDTINLMVLVKEKFITLSDDEQQSLENEYYERGIRNFEEEKMVRYIRCMSHYIGRNGRAISYEDYTKFIKFFNQRDSYLIYADRQELAKILSLFLTTWSNDVRYRVTSVSSIVRAHFSKELDTEDFEELCNELLIIKYTKATLSHAYNEKKVNAIVETRLDRGHRTIILSEIKAKEIEDLELVKIVDYNSCLNTPESITKKNIEVLPDDF